MELVRARTQGWGVRKHKWCAHPSRGVRTVGYKTQPRAVNMNAKHRVKSTEGRQGCETGQSSRSANQY